MLAAPPATRPSLMQLNSKMLLFPLLFPLKISPGQALILAPHREVLAVKVTARCDGQFSLHTGAGVSPCVTVFTLLLGHGSVHRLPIFFPCPAFPPARGSGIPLLPPCRWSPVRVAFRGSVGDRLTSLYPTSELHALVLNSVLCT